MNAAEAQQVLYIADGLIEADDTQTSGFVIPMPCQRVAEGLVTVWPSPKVSMDAEGKPVSVVLNLSMWLVTYHGMPENPVVLPLHCDHQPAAQVTGEKFTQHVAEGRIDPRGMQSITTWCAWWCEKHPGVHQINPRRLQRWPFLAS